MLTSFSHVMMYVNDVARAAKWYEDILGFKPVMVMAPHYGMGDPANPKIAPAGSAAAKPERVA